MTEPSVEALRQALQHAEARLHRTESHLQCFAELSGAWYWEQDPHQRFTRVQHNGVDLAQTTGLQVGRTCRELGGVPVTDGSSWESHQAEVAAQQPFSHFLLRWEAADGDELYLASSGRPRFDAQGNFQGYHGLTRDVTKAMLDERHAETIQLAAVGIGHVGLDGRFIHVNGKLCDMLGYSRAELLALSFEDITHPDDKNITDDFRARLHSGEIQSFNLEKRYLRKDGASIWVGLTVAGKRNAQGESLYDVSVVEDLSEKKAMEIALRNSEELFHSTFELAAIGICHVNQLGCFIHVNQKLCDMLGYEREELLGRTAKSISHPDDENITDEIRAKLRSGAIDSFKMEKRYLCKDGSPRWAALTITVKRDSRGDVLYDISIIEDISARKKAEERVQYLATHDDMTGLPNRVLFGQMLREAIKAGERYKRRFALLFIDLDRFKQVNDSLGHEAGDVLLKEISKRYALCLRASDVVARLGGDEFVVLVHEVNEPAQVATVARNLLSASIRPVKILGQECRVTASIGVCMYPADAQEEQALMKGADMAMYMAKEDGKNNFRFFSQEIASHAIEKLALEVNLRRAMELNEFSLHYQAKVNIQSGQICGVEALLRWNNPSLGSVAPNQFIPVAEEMGLIIPLGKWVIDQASKQAMAWRLAGLPPVCISVNLSPRQFSDPDLLEFLQETLDRTGIEPALLELEITESMVMLHPERASRILSEMKAMGLRIAIDDFGTGYSSLSQLKHFPVDTLKVDRSFIRNVHNDKEGQAITQAIISMGKTLGLTVVAEGVETAEQQTFLSNHACDEMQGFYFSMPADADQFARLLRTHIPIPFE